MNFSYHYLGRLSRGQTFSVKLNRQAHVALLDTQNLSRYFHGQNFRHYGKLQSYHQEKYYIPATGEWHLVVYGNSEINPNEVKITLA